jgi:hypothetical protein
MSIKGNLLEKDINVDRTVDAVSEMDFILCYDLSFGGYVTREVLRRC